MIQEEKSLRDINLIRAMLHTRETDRILDILVNKHIPFNKEVFLEYNKFLNSSLVALTISSLCGKMSLSKRLVIREAASEYFNPIDLSKIYAIEFKLKEFLESMSSIENSAKYNLFLFELCHTTIDSYGVKLGLFPFREFSPGGLKELILNENGAFGKLYGDYYRIHEKKITDRLTLKEYKKQYEFVNYTYKESGVRTIHRGSEGDIHE